MFTCWEQIRANNFFHHLENPAPVQLELVSNFPWQFLPLQEAEGTNWSIKQDPISIVDLVAGHAKQPEFPTILNFHLIWKLKAFWNMPLPATMQEQKAFQCLMLLTILFHVQSFKPSRREFL